MKLICMQKREHTRKLRQGRTLLDDVRHGYKMVPLYCTVYKAEGGAERDRRRAEDYIDRPPKQWHFAFLSALS